VSRAQLIDRDGGLEELSIRPAGTDDLLYVMSLMRANRESVGGLPAPAVLDRLDAGTLTIGELNEEPMGYLLYDVTDNVLRIPQACIQYDARRRKYGEALVGALLAAYPNVEEVQLRCAADLEANLFWRDMGFTCTGTSDGGRRRGRKINSWTMWLTPRLITLDEIRVVPAADLRVDCMYDDTDFLTDTPDGFAPARELPKLAWANRKQREGGRP
jgi:hypothetical protein